MGVSEIPKTKINDITIEWIPEKGICTFEALPVAMMWIDTTLAGLMSGLQNMVGTRRFNLALQSEGRKSVEADWQVFRNFSSFTEGFKAISNIAAVAGWGHWKLLSIDKDKKKCYFQVNDSWEGLCQKTLGVCWGSGMVAGKFAGYCSKYFKTNCWAEQTKFIAKGDNYDEFIVSPSNQTIEEEIEKLLVTDEATKADMAVALVKLRKEIEDRTRAENKLKLSEKKFRDAYNRAEFYKELFAHDINNLFQGILSSNQLMELILKDYKITPDIQKYLNIIDNQVQRGSKLINNVRKLSQIEETSRVLERIEILSILRNSIKRLIDSNQQKRININVDTSEEKIYILANELIEDVVENILINGINHNKSSIIKINVKISMVKIEGIPNYKIEFMDNGEGIQDDRKASIFLRLLGKTKSVSGMGLGLSLVYKIIESYNGKIWVENVDKGDYSKGSNFIVVIPKAE